MSPSLNEVDLFIYTVKPVLSGPHIKRTPCIDCIKLTPASVPNFSSHIYCKMNLYSADTNLVPRNRDPGNEVERTPLLSGRGHRNGADLSPKTCTEWTLQEILELIFVIL